MNAVIEALSIGFIRAIVAEFVAWSSRKQRPEGWKPSQTDVDEFLSEIAADTPEALKAKVAALIGAKWPPDPVELPPGPPPNPTIPGVAGQ